MCCLHITDDIIHTYDGMSKVRSDKSPNGTGVGVIRDVHMCNDGGKMVMKE